MNGHDDALRERLAWMVHQASGCGPMPDFLGGPGPVCEPDDEDYAAADALLASDWLADVRAEAAREAHAEVANAFVAWAGVNEIAAPPLDWSWFGEITRRYSPLHEEHDADRIGGA